MENCTKTIKYTMRDMGIVGKSKCNKPVFKDNMCLAHYNNTQKKLVKWEDRIDYRQATIEDILGQRSLKLKTTNTNQLFKYGKDKFIWKYNTKTGKWDIKTDYTINSNLFVVKH